MSALRVFMTPAGPVCGSCVEERYGVKIVQTSGPIGYEVEGGDKLDVFPPPLGEFEGDFCIACQFWMSADGTFDGREMS